MWWCTFGQDPSQHVAAGVPCAGRAEECTGRAGRRAARLARRCSPCLLFLFKVYVYFVRITMTRPACPVVPTLSTMVQPAASAGASFQPATASVWASQRAHQELPCAASACNPLRAYQAPNTVLLSSLPSTQRRSPGHSLRMGKFQAAGVGRDGAGGSVTQPAARLPRTGCPNVNGRVCATRQKEKSPVPARLPN